MNATVFSTPVSPTGSCNHYDWNAFFIVRPALTFVLTILAIIFYSTILTVLREKAILHCNVRVLLKNCSITAVCYCLGLCVRSFYDLAYVAQPLFVDRPATTVIKPLTCAILESPYVICNGAYMISIASIGVERWSAARRDNGHRSAPEDPLAESGRADGLTYFLIIIGWFIGFSSQILLLWDVGRSEKTVCYCSYAYVSSFWLLTIRASCQVFVKIFVVIMYLYVYRVNKCRFVQFSMNTATHNLQRRFQLHENIRTTTMLFPSVLAHTIVYVGASIAYLVAAQLRDIRYGRYGANLIQGAEFLIAVDLLAAPIIWLYYNARLRRLVCASFPCVATFFPRRTLNELAGSQRVLQRPPARAPVPRRASAAVADFCNRSIGGARSVSETPYRILKPRESVVAVDYRVRPESHNALLDRIWESASNASWSNSAKSSACTLPISHSASTSLRISCKVRNQMFASNSSHPCIVGDLETGSPSEVLLRRAVSTKCVSHCVSQI